MTQTKPHPLTTREDEILADWPTLSGQTPIADGCVDPETWLELPTRVVFILKEVNLQGSPRLAHLRKALRAGGNSEQIGLMTDSPERRAQLLGHTWTNIIRWLHGLVAANEVPWRDADAKGLASISVATHPALLRQICLVNLNKYGGGRKAGAPTINRAVKENHGRLRRQLALYTAADVFVCGGTDKWVRKFGLLEPEQRSGAQRFEWQHTPRGVPYHVLSTGQVVIRHCHPNARVGGHLLVYPLLDAIEWLQRQRVGRLG